MSAAVSRRRGRRLLVLAFLAAVAAATAPVWLEVREWQRGDRIAALQKERDELRARLAVLSAKDAVVASAPDAEVLVGVPAGVAADLLGQVTTRLVRRLEVVLRNLDVHKAGFVRAKTFLGRRTAGRYRVDVRIHEVSALLEPGAPKLDVRGDGVRVALPVKLARGEGRATLHLRWDSRGIAGVACGDFRESIPVGGRIVPRTYPVSGSVALELVDGALVATPSFPDLVVNVQVEPSADTWKEVDRVLARRGAPCRAALKLVNVPALLRSVLDRGFNVKVPRRPFTPLRLPAGLRREVSVGGRTHLVMARPRQLALTPELVWLGADLVGGAGPESPSAPE